MPDIPYAGDTLIKPQALPGVRQSINVGPDAFGAAGGRALEKVAGDMQQVGRVAERMFDFVDQEDTRKAREAWAQAQADTEVATEEAKARKGVDVAPKDKPTVSQSYHDQLRDIYGKSTQGLSDNARAKFNAMWGPNATVRLGQIQRHEKEQLDEVDIASSQVNVDISHKYWAGDPLSKDVVENAKRNIGAEMQYLGQKKHWSPDVVQQHLDAEITKGHLNAVSALAAADRAGEAQAYYEKYKNEIDPRARDDIEAKLKTQTEATLSQTSADQLWAKHKGDLTAALDEARKSHTGALEEKVVLQLKTRADEAERAKAKMQHTSFNAALQKIIDAPTSAEALTAAMKADVEPDLRLRLVNVANGLARAETAQGNPAGAVEVMELVDQGKITDAKTAQAAAAERGLSKKEISDTVKYVQQGGLSGDVKMSEVTTLAKKWKPKITGEEVGQLAQYIIDDLKKQAPGKPVTSEELSQRVAGYLWKGETTQRLKPDGSIDKPGWFTPGAGWNETALQARRSGSIESWIPDVSAEEEIDLRAELSDITGAPPAAFDLDALRVFKKQKAGMPLGAVQQTKVPKKAPKAVAAPPDTGPSARQRNAAAAAASILDNSGTN